MKKLKMVLMINGVSSGLTGVLMTAFAPFITEIFNTSLHEPFVYVGAFLIFFSLFVVFTARQSPPSEALVKIITVLDVSWVLGSAMIVVFQMFNLSMIGYTIILIVAIWVLAMAFLQQTYVRKLRQDNLA